jgi:hypothetical protein
MLRVLAILALFVVQADEKRLRDKWDSINEFLKTAKAPSALRAAVDDLIALSDEAITLDSYDLALKTAEQAEKIAKSLKDPAISAQAKVARAKQFQQEWSRVRGYLKILEEKPEDPEANLAVGKFLCLMKGDWVKGIPLMRKGSDPVLRGLAELDSVGAASGEERMQIGERWGTYSEKNPKFRERALFWCKEAWPDLAGIPKEKARARAAELQTVSSLKDKEWTFARHVSGWTFSGDSGLGLKYAVSGKASARIAKLSNQPCYVMMDRQPAKPGKDYVVSLYVLSDQTEAPGGHVAIYFYDKDSKSVPGKSEPIPPDFPFWQKIEFKGMIPPDAAMTAFDVVLDAQKGSIWIDDISVKVDGVEMIKNGSFEDK